MSSKLFVGSLSFNVDQNELEQVFADFGSVKSVKIITDRETGRSRGFGFVEMQTPAEAEEALSSVNGMEINGRNVVVNIATDKPRTSSFDNQRNKSW